MVQVLAALVLVVPARGVALAASSEVPADLVQVLAARSALMVLTVMVAAGSVVMVALMVLTVLMVLMVLWV